MLLLRCHNGCCGVLKQIGCALYRLPDCYFSSLSGRIGTDLNAPECFASNGRQLWRRGACRFGCDEHGDTLSRTTLRCGCRMPIVRPFFVALSGNSLFAYRGEGANAGWSGSVHFDAAGLPRCGCRLIVGEYGLSAGLGLLRHDRIVAGFTDRLRCRDGLGRDNWERGGSLRLQDLRSAGLMARYGGRHGSGHRKTAATSKSVV